jgi:hypothetical protein
MKEKANVRVDLQAKFASLQQTSNQLMRVLARVRRNDQDPLSRVSYLNYGSFDISGIIQNGLSHDSSVGIVMGHGLDGQGSIPGTGKIFPFLIAFRTALGTTKPPIRCVSGALSPKRDTYYSSPSSAEVKNSGPYLHSPI